MLSRNQKENAVFFLSCTLLLSFPCLIIIGLANCPSYRIYWIVLYWISDYMAISSSGIVVGKTITAMVFLLVCLSIEVTQ